jgi:ABC-type phosphonate transport system ATPase subunit
VKDLINVRSVLPADTNGDEPMKLEGGMKQHSCVALDGNAHIRLLHIGHRTERLQCLSLRARILKNL